MPAKKNFNVDKVRLESLETQVRLLGKRLKELEMYKVTETKPIINPNGPFGDISITYRQQLVLQFCLETVRKLADLQSFRPDGSAVFVLEDLMEIVKGSHRVSQDYADMIDEDIC